MLPTLFFEDDLDGNENLEADDEDEPTESSDPKAAPNPPLEGVNLLEVGSSKESSASSVSVMSPGLMMGGRRTRLRVRRAAGSCLKRKTNVLTPKYWV